MLRTPSIVVTTLMLGLAGAVAVPVASAWGFSAPAPAATAPPAGVQLAPQELIDINRATESRLQDVPGIGPALAARIVAWREEHGPFERLEDLLNVRGIGVRTLEKLRPYLRVEPADPAEAAVAAGIG